MRLTERLRGRLREKGVGKRVRERVRERIMTKRVIERVRERDKKLTSEGERKRGKIERGK